MNTIIALFGPPQFKNPLHPPFPKGEKVVLPFFLKGNRLIFPLFSKGGQGGIWPALKETARFVMFKKPFEEVINTKNLIDMEKTSSVHKTESYRVYPIKQETLLEERWDIPEEDKEIKEKTSKRSKETGQPSASLYKERFASGRYEGNKWGGKYLRAPDIFFTILEKSQRYRSFEYGGEHIIVEDVTDMLED